MYKVLTILSITCLLFTLSNIGELTDARQITTAFLNLIAISVMTLLLYLGRIREKRLAQCAFKEFGLTQ